MIAKLVHGHKLIINYIKNPKFSVSLSNQIIINVILFIIVISLSTFFLLKHTNQELKILGQELQGLQYDGKLVKLLSDITEHSVLKLQYEAGSTDTKQEIDLKNQQIYDNFESVITQYNKLNPGSTLSIEQMQIQWNQIIAKPSISFDDYSKLYIPLIKQIKEIINYVAIHSKLFLNTEISLYHLSYAILYSIPYTFELVTSIIHQIYPLALKPDKPDNINKQKLMIAISFLEKLNQKIYKELNTTLYNDLPPRTKHSLILNIEKYQSSLNMFLKYSDQLLLDSYEIKPEIIMLAYNNIVEASNSLYLITCKALTDVLYFNLHAKKVVFLKILFTNILILICSVISYQLIKHNIIKPIRAIRHIMLSLANNKLDTPIPYRDRLNEIGDMARALELFKDTAIQAQQMAKTQYNEKISKEKRNQDIKEQINNFDHRISNILEIFSSAIAELINKVNTVSNSARIASQKAKDVDDISQIVVKNVNIVESSTDELISSISDMSDHISKSNITVNTAVESSNKADNIIQKLSDNSKKIGTVINIIYNITHKINFLALNATIESSKAGSSGKGFAVVASEVKSLANQTAQSTDEIYSCIREIQVISNEVISTLEYISNAINDIKQVYANLTDNLTHQNTTTSDIANTMHTASKYVEQLSSNITTLNNISYDTNTCSQELLEVLEELIKQSGNLKTEIIDFLAKMRNE